MNPTGGWSWRFWRSWRSWPARPALRWIHVGFAGALVAAWLSAGLAPVRDAVVGARAPSDFATDFVPASRLGGGRGAPAGAASPAVDVDSGNAAAVGLGAPAYARVGVPFGAHPPPAVLLVAALVPLGFGGAAAAWLALSLLALAVIAWVSVDQLTAGAATPGPGAARERRSPGLVAVLGTFLALAVWPPVLHNLEKGQWSVLLAGLLAGAWWARTRRRDGLAGSMVAAAACFKIMPLLVLPAILVGPSRRRRATLLGAALTLLFAVAVSGARLGPMAWVDFVRAAPLNVRGWQTGPANTLSLWGALARLLIGGPFARPPGPCAAHAAIAAGLARLLWLVGALTLVWGAARATGGGGGDDGSGFTRPQDPRSDRDRPAAFAAWSVVAVLLGPLAWSHAAVMLVLPGALVIGGQRMRAAARGPDLGWTATAAAAVLLTIPRQTLFRWAGPLPVAPARGVFLALHLVGGLALLAGAVRLNRRAVASALRPNGQAPTGAAAGHQPAGVA